MGASVLLMLVLMAVMLALFGVGVGSSVGNVVGGGGHFWLVVVVVVFGMWRRLWTVVCQTVIDMYIQHEKKGERMREVTAWEADNPPLQKNTERGFPRYYTATDTYPVKRGLSASSSGSNSSGWECVRRFFDSAHASGQKNSAPKTGGAREQNN